MSRQAIINTLILLVGLFVLYVLFNVVRDAVPRPQTPTLPTGEPVFCTQDAKICPDGTAVGRIPPTCDFAPCQRVN